MQTIDSLVLSIKTFSVCVATTGSAVVGMSLADVAWTTELGVAGLVASAAFSFAVYVHSSSNKREMSRVTQFTNTVETLCASHREERGEWRADASQRQQQSERVVASLENTIREILDERRKQNE